MALIELRREASDRELKVFACLLLPLFGAVVGAVLTARFGWWYTAAGVWAAVAAGAVEGYVAPRRMLPVFRAWMTLAYPIGWTVGHFVMGATYFLVITPIGLMLRLLGRDPMCRRFEPVRSYWVRRREDPALERYFRQF